MNVDPRVNWEGRADLYELLAAWCDGTLDEVACRRLEGLLGPDNTDAGAAARRLYIEYLDMHARLHWDRREPVMARAVQRAALKTAALMGRLDASPLAKRSGAALKRHGGSSLFTRVVPRLIHQRRRYLAAAAVVLLAAVTAAWFVFQGGGRDSGPVFAQSRQNPAIPFSLPSPHDASGEAPPASEYPAAKPSAVIAHLGKLVNCRWADSRAPLAPGDALRAGQVVRLADGVAEIRFDLGVRVVVQAPAVLVLEAAKSARLERGKLSAEITSAAARGFQIRTPASAGRDNDFVDQGTEFGVEVSPDDNSRVHVFKGEVDVKHGFSGGPSAPQRLMARAEAWLEKDSQTIQLREDTGSSFIRDVRQADRDRHVVAYWRFEDRPLGTVVPDTMHNKRSVRATLDSSFNGNDLFAFSDVSHPSFSGGVPAAMVRGTGEPNLGCLDNSEPFHPGGSRDLYTHSAFSHAAPLDLQSIEPAEWTIEASVKPAVLEGKAQTFVGRDGNEPHAGITVPTRLAFHINNQNRFAIWFVDVRQRRHEATAKLELRAGAWYHVAATSDGRALRLYVDELDGRGYQLRAETPLPEDGGTALSKGGDSFTGGCSAEWSVGRGKSKNHVAEVFRGWIDEVRISDVARKPAEFLFSQRRDTGTDTGRETGRGRD